MVEFGVDPTKFSYTLRCKVLVKEFSHDDEQSKETFRRTSKGVFLLPQQSSTTERFFDAWLPECRNNAPDKRIAGEGPQYNEVGCRAGYPVDGHFRCAVMRRKSWPHDVDSHYLFVMHLGAQRDLLEYWEGSPDAEVIVEVLPATESGDGINSSPVDQARDVDLPDRTIFGDDMLPNAPRTGFR